MNDKDKLWTITHDIVEMIEKDLGPFKNMAMRVAYDYIQEMNDNEVAVIVKKIKTIINFEDDQNAKKAKKA